MPKPLPKLIQNVFSRILAVKLDELVTFSPHEVAREDDALLQHLTESGLLKSLRTAPECIECGSATELRGKQEQKVAVCDVCSAVFPRQQRKQFSINPVFTY